MASSRDSTLIAGAAACALAFWALCVVQRVFVGPLGVDEIYFAHVLWLVGQGQRLYVDFHSQHLPTYFLLMKPLVSAVSPGPSDLEFVWAMRGVSAAMLLAYLVIGWFLHRMLPVGGRLGLLAVWSLLLLFVVHARFLELRADSVGLLLMNTAWAAALSRVSRPRLLLAAVLAGASVLFSGRAGFMALAAGGCLLYLAYRARDMRAFRALIFTALAFAAVLAAIYWSDPAWTTLVVQSAVLDPVQFIIPLSLWRRIVPLDRAILLFLIVIALLSGLRMVRRGQAERGIVVAGASVGQLLLIFIDPVPYQYVYGWATVPVLFGVVSLSRRFAALFSGGMAVLYLPGVFPLVAATPFSPPQGSLFQPVIGPVLSREVVQRIATPELVRMMLNGEWQQNLASQLRVREEVCRRVGGKVLVSWAFHPICLPDANYHWTGLRWPIPVQGVVTGSGRSMDEFEFLGIITTTKPSLFVWLPGPGRSPRLPRTLEQTLTTCYDRFEGFALPNSRPCREAKPQRTPAELLPS